MILAAGRGERMRPLSDRVPKPLLPVAGKPLIVWHLERLARGGFREIVINHAHLGDQIEALLGDGAAWGLRIHYSAEPQGALETAGGVVQALPLLGDEPFFLLSADIYVAADYRRLAVAPVDLTGTMTAFLWLVDNPVWHDRGDFAIAEGHLVPEGEPMLTYANLGVFHPAFFAGIEPGTRLPLLPLIRRAMAERRILAARLAGPWDNIGSPEQLAALDGHLRRAC